MCLQFNPGLDQYGGGLGWVEHADTLVVGAFEVVDVGVFLIVDRAEEHEFAPIPGRVRLGRPIDAPARHRRVQPVGRADQFRSGVFEQVELVMEVVDRTYPVAFGNTPIEARRQHQYPQYDYEDQQDHTRHSPTNLPSLRRRP